MIDDLLKIQAELDAMPPAPRCIMASHQVPYGRVYRQWNTRGELIYWANRGELADLPHVKYAEIVIPISSLVPVGICGIPVVNAWRSARA